MKKVAYFILILILIPTLAYSHSGRTDAQGGHYNRKTGGYHYHGRPSSSQRTYTAPKKNEYNKSDDDEIEVIVYITRTGSKYHRGNCRYLKYSKFPVSKKGAIGVRIFTV